MVYLDSRYINRSDLKTINLSNKGKYEKKYTLELGFLTNLTILFYYSYVQIRTFDFSIRQFFIKSATEICNWYDFSDLLLKLISIFSP